MNTALSAGLLIIGVLSESELLIVASALYAVSAAIEYLHK